MKIFPSYLQALTYLVEMGDHGPHYFDVEADKADGSAEHEWITESISRINPEEITPEIASTLAAYAMRDGRSIGVVVSLGDMAGGVIVGEYALDGTPIRFVAIP